MSSVRFEPHRDILAERLAERFLRNTEGKVFLPNGVSREVFKNHRGKLKILFQVLFGIQGDHEVALAYVLDRKVLCNILATLLFMRSEQSAFERFKCFIPLQGTGKPALLVDDDEMPFPRDDAERIFANWGADFYREQFIFCPVVLQESHEIAIREGDFRLPYLEQEEIDSGSSGMVYRVKIAEGHFKSKQGFWNESPTYYARKDFRDRREKAFQEESKIVLEILRQPTRHENIMVTLLSLQSGDTYSLFFELASCNLWQYLTDQNKRGICGPANLLEKSVIFRQGVNLAGALAFLHDQFQGPAFEELSCYHLDLKPHNILVFNAQTESEVWKITDFGMSRIKEKRIKRSDRERPYENFLGRKMSSSNGSTDVRRGEGTYLAPESRLRGRLSAASDVWSFGCVFSLIMTFIDDGPHGVRTFSGLRADADVSDDDAFFIINNKRALLSPVVTKWFNTLISNSTQRDSNVEYPIFLKTLDFLRNRVLVPGIERRVKAKEVKENLGKIIRLFSKESHPRSPRRRSVLDRTKSKLMSLSLKSAGHSSQKLILSKTMYGSLFSPKGELLALYSPHRIDVFVVDKIKEAINQGHPSKSSGFIESHDPWQGCFINSIYLCAYAQTSQFECYFYSISDLLSGNAGISSEKKVSDPGLGSIQKLSMSRDGNYTACAVKYSSRTQSSAIQIYLFYTDDLLANAGENLVSPRSSQSNSTGRSGSSDTFPACPNIIVESSFPMQMARIWSLAFSRDNNFLILVAETGEGNLLIRVWDTVHGSLHGQDTAKLIGSSISTHTLFTACSPFLSRMKPELLVISQQKNIIRTEDCKMGSPCRLKAIRMRDVLVREDDEEIILLADNGRTDVLRAYAIAMSNIDDSDVTRSEIAEIGFPSYNPSKDCSILMEPNGRGERDLLVATSDGLFVSITLPYTRPLGALQ